MKLLTAEDLSQRWSVPKQHVYRLARDGVIPVIELGKYKRFHPDAIEQFEKSFVTRDGKESP